MKHALNILALTAVLCAHTLATAAPPSKIALKGATVIPITGPVIPGATILVDSGKITAVGKDVEIPYDHIVYDLVGKVVFPGTIEADTCRGMDRCNERLAVTPYLDVYDALDPSQSFFENALRDGRTSIHVIPGSNCVIGGIGRVVKPIGMTPEQMTTQPGEFLRVSMGPMTGKDRMAQMATLRETFLELDDYLKKLAESKYEEKLKEDEKKIDVGPTEARERGKELITPADYDDKHARLLELREGRIGAFIHCERAMDVDRAIAYAKENGFFDKTVLTLGSECYKAITELKAANRPVVLTGDPLYKQEDPYTGKIEETFVPKVLADAGLIFALTPGPDRSLTERYMTYQAARCIREGVPRDFALKAITLYPAQILGLDNRLGSIEPGKEANLVVYSGDPLDLNSWVDYVFIEGIMAYDRDKDVRLHELFTTDDTAEDDRPTTQNDSQPSTQDAQ